MAAGGTPSTALPAGLRLPFRSATSSSATPPTGFGAFVRDARTARVEAILFLAEEPINTRKISQLANLADGTEARTLIRRLNEMYDRQGSAFRAEEVAGGIRLLTRRKFAGWLRRLVRTHVETRLSTPALETLAVAAYRQPVTRAEVEAIRGVQCDEMLRQLMERDLLKIVGRSEELGRPFLYGTTKRFLQFFGLRHLDDLPRAAALRNPGLQTDRAGSSAAGESGAEADDEQPDFSTVNRSIEESDVKIATDSDLAREEELERRRLPWADEIRAEDDEDDDFEDEDEDEDEDDDLDDDEDEEEDDFEDDDFDDDWEEVDDEEDEDDEDEDEDWDDDEEDDDEDDDWDDDEEEEEDEDDDE